MSDNLLYRDPEGQLQYDPTTGRLLYRCVAAAGEHCSCCTEGTTRKFYQLTTSGILLCGFDVCTGWSALGIEFKKFVLTGSLNKTLLLQQQIGDPQGLGLPDDPCSWVYKDTATTVDVWQDTTGDGLCDTKVASKNPIWNLQRKCHYWDFFIGFTDIPTMQWTSDPDGDEDCDESKTLSLVTASSCTYSPAPPYTHASPYAYGGSALLVPA